MNWVVKLKAVNIDQVMISDKAKIFMQGGRENMLTWLPKFEVVQHQLRVISDGVRIFM